MPGGLYWNTRGGLVSGLPNFLWTRTPPDNASVRAACRRAVEAGAAVKIADALIVAAELLWPGYLLLYDEAILDVYLRDREDEITPLFRLPTRDLSLVRLACVLYATPAAGRYDAFTSYVRTLLPETAGGPPLYSEYDLLAPFRDREDFQRLLRTGPRPGTKSSERDLEAVLQAGVHSGSLFLPDELEIPPLCEPVYTVEDGLRLARELLGQPRHAERAPQRTLATPFEGPGGRALVVGCSDPASLKMLHAVNQAVIGPPKQFRAASIAARLSPAQRRKLCRENLVLLVTRISQLTEEVCSVRPDLAEAGWSHHRDIDAGTAGLARTLRRLRLMGFREYRRPAGTTTPEDSATAQVREAREALRRQGYPV